LNRVRYSNPDFDALLDRYFTTIPRQERTQVLGQIVHFMTEQLLTLGIFYTAEASLVDNRLQNVSMRKTEEGRVPWNAHEWSVK
jgi:ABC-type transport system substrate-binding protein